MLVGRRTGHARRSCSEPSVNNAQVEARYFDVDIGLSERWTRRRLAVFRYEGPKRLADLVVPAPRDGHCQSVEALFELLQDNRVALYETDLLDNRWNRRLDLGCELFIELLAGAQAGEQDRHVLVGNESGQADDLFRQIQDPHGLAHLEHGDAPCRLR